VSLGNISLIFSEIKSVGMNLIYTIVSKKSIRYCAEGGKFAIVGKNKTIWEMFIIYHIVLSEMDKVTAEMILTIITVVIVVVAAYPTAYSYCFKPESNCLGIYTKCCEGSILVSCVDCNFEFWGISICNKSG
jgi:hypothetical protein